MEDQSRAQAIATLRQIIAGMKTSQALHVAAKLNVADHLSRKPMNASELATATGTDPAALHRLMRALCALGVFAESSGGEFSLNPAAEMLRTDVPGSFRAAVLFLVGDVRWRCWADLLGTSVPESEERRARLEWNYLSSTPRIRKNRKSTITL